MTPNSFNVRVYGLLIKDNHILVSDELIGSTAMTKYPGGGLEFGEGIAECLHREFEEELDIAIKIKTLFYVNDFYQTSAFNPMDQLVSVYYIVEQTDSKKIRIAKRPLAFTPPSKQCFRWMDIDKLREIDLTYPVDQKVALLLKKRND